MMRKATLLVLAAALLLFSGDGFYRAVRGRVAVSVTCEDLVRDGLPAPRVRVSGCNIFYGGIGYRGRDGTIDELYLPVQPLEAHGLPARIVISSAGCRSARHRRPRPRRRAGYDARAIARRDAEGRRASRPRHGVHGAGAHRLDRPAAIAADFVGTFRRRRRRRGHTRPERRAGFSPACDRPDCRRPARAARVLAASSHRHELRSPRKLPFRPPLTRLRSSRRQRRLRRRRLHVQPGADRRRSRCRDSCCSRCLSTKGPRRSRRRRRSDRGWRSPRFWPA